MRRRTMRRRLLAAFVAVTAFAHAAYADMPKHYQPPVSYDAAAIAEMQAVAETGDIKAMLTLGQVYAFDQAQKSSYEQNRQQAIAWYEKAAAAGSAEAMLRLGQLYGDHYNMQPFSPADGAEAISWYEKAAAHGSAQAMTALGRMYAHEDSFSPGGSVPPDEDQAFAWLERAVAGGDSLAKPELAYLWAHTKTRTPNYSLAYQLYLDAAQAGDEGAMAELDQEHVYGKEVSSAEESFKRLRRDAVAGDAGAQWRLGRLYLDDGPNYDQDQAFKWLKASAAQNDPAGIYYLGMAYQDTRPSRTGINMPLVQRAAEMGYLPAQLTITEFSGMSIPSTTEDEKNILAWLQTAAEKDNSEAQAFLADYYAQGVGVAQDGAEAWKWFVLANRSPFRQAYMDAGLQPAPTAEEKAEGQRRADQWLSAHPAPRWPRPQ